MKILAVIPTYNRVELLERLLISLSKVESPPFDALVIDDCSSQDYSGMLSKDFGFSLEYFRKDSNSGLQNSYNRSIDYALNNGYDYIWIIDDDTVVDSFALEHLMKIIMADGAVSAVGSAVYDIDLPNVLRFLGLKVDAKKNGIHFILSGNDIDALGNCSSLIRLSDIKKYGLKFDENYWLRYDDADFYLSLKRAGGKIVCVPQSVVYHELKESSAQLFYYDYRNACYIADKLKLFPINNEKLLIEAVNHYWCGNFLIASAKYNALYDFYSGRMGKNDLYSSAGIERIDGRDEFSGKNILVIGIGAKKFIDLSLKLIRKQCADADYSILSDKPEYAPVMPILGRIIRPGNFLRRLSMYIKLFKKYDYVVISDPGINNIAFPLLGKKILQPDTHNLSVFSPRLSAAVKFTINAAYLFLRIKFRNFFYIFQSDVEARQVIFDDYPDISQ